MTGCQLDCVVVSLTVMAQWCEAMQSRLNVLLILWWMAVHRMQVHDSALHSRDVGEWVPTQIGKLKRYPLFLLLRPCWRFSSRSLSIEDLFILRRFRRLGLIYVPVGWFFVLPFYGTTVYLGHAIYGRLSVVNAEACDITGSQLIAIVTLL